MKNKIGLVIISLAIVGCTSHSGQESRQTGIRELTCPGTTSLPDSLSEAFTEVVAPELLAESLGEPGKGGLCQGKVYQSKPGTVVRLYRAWNSTNSQSKTGHWWAFYKPSGAISGYRAEYEICYQWSPLDMMSECHLKPGTKVVIGTGQSAVCSEYLSYPASEKQQIYLSDGKSSLMDCTDFTGMIAWQ